MNINWGTFIDNIYKIAGVGSAVFVAYQSAMFKKDYNLRNDKAEREKAIELTRFYSETIIPKISYFYHVFKEVGIEEIVEKLDFSDLREFDRTELEKLIGKQNIETINDKIKNIDIEVLIEARKLLKEVTLSDFHNDLSTIKINKIFKSKIEAATTLEEIRDIKATKQINENFKKDISSYYYYKNKYYNEFNSMITDTANLLEYFCMNFNSGIADEKTIYQSVHQSFLGCVRLLYYWIAQQNSCGKDKYYTNIIELFNSWSSRYSEKCEEETELQRKTTYKNKPLKK